MTDLSQLTPELAEIMAAGLVALDRLRDTQREKRAAEEASRQANIKGTRDLFEADLLAGIEPALLPYFVPLTFEGDEVPNDEVTIEFKIPGCAPIRQTFRRAGKSDNWKPFQYNNAPKYCVPHYAIRPVYSDDDPEEQQVVEVGRSDQYSRYYGHDTLSMALALAAEWAKEKGVLEAQVAAFNAVSSSKHAAAEAKRLNQQSARESGETAERDALFDLIVNDPVAVALLKVFTAIKQERAGYTEAIDNLHETLEIQGEHYEQRLSEKALEADRALRNSKDDADRAQREADDLQAKLTRLKREAQYA